jgi:hypothetical protein
MFEVLGSIALFIVAYPANIVVYGLDQPTLILSWFAIGAVVLFLLVWRKQQLLRAIWVALWFMPGAIVCGAAALLPWPPALWAHFGPGNCASVQSLLIAFVLNVAVVFGIVGLLRWLQRRRQSHNNVLQGDARNARA